MSGAAGGAERHRETCRLRTAKTDAEADREVLEAPPGGEHVVEAGLGERREAGQLEGHTAANVQAELRGAAIRRLCSRGDVGGGDTTEAIEPDPADDVRRHRVRRRGRVGWSEMPYRIAR